MVPAKRLLLCAALLLAAGALADLALQGREPRLSGARRTPAPAPVAAEEGKAPTGPDPAPVPAAVVAGTVVDGTGAPVQRAQVRLVYDGSDEAGASTSANGRFAIPYPGAGTVQCYAEKTGYVSAAGPELAADGRSRIHAGRLILRRGGRSISGTVVDASGAPDCGVEIRIDSERPDESWARRWEGLDVRADKAGGFTFSGLAAGLYSVSAGANHAVTRQHVPAGKRNLQLVLPASESRQTCTVRAHVLLPDGSPLPRGDLVVSGRAAWSRVSIQDGGIYGTGLSAVGPFSVVVEHPQSADGLPLPLVSPILEGLGGGEHDLRIVLRPGDAKLGGRVVAAGRGVVGAKVFATPHATVKADFLHPPDHAKGLVLDSDIPTLDEMFEARTDDQGRFVFPAVYPGSYEVYAHAPGLMCKRHAVARAGDTAVTVEMASTVDEPVSLQASEGPGFPGSIDWALYEAGAGEGQPLMTGDASGVGKRSASWTLSGIESGVLYRLEVGWARPYAPTSVTFMASEQELAVPVFLGRAVKGRVVRADGSAVVGAHVALAPDEVVRPYNVTAEYEALQGANTRSGLDGRFELDGLPRSSIALLAWTPGLMQPSGPVKVAADAGEPVTIRLVEAATIAGRIAPPLRGDMSVEFWRTEGAPVNPPRTISGADGFFRSPPLAPGRYRIVVWDTGFVDDDRNAVTDPVPAGAQDLHVALVAGGRITGRVRDAAGVAVQRACVLCEAGAWTRLVHTDASGRFVIPGLPRGEYQVRALVDSGPQQPVAAAPGDNLDLRVPVR